MIRYSPLAKYSRELVPLLFGFIVWPFGTLLYTLKNTKSRDFLIIYTLFCILFCWNLDVVNTSYDDLSGIAGLFMYIDSSSAAFLQRFHDYITFSPNANREIYFYLMAWITRLFSDNPHTFFALCSIPYLFFQVKSFKLILEDDRYTKGMIGILIIFLFMCPRDIITVQNPRFTTALWLCIYVVIKSFHPLTKNKKHLLWLLLSPTIHSSFWFIGVLISLGILIAKRGLGQRGLIALVYISIPFSYLSSDILQGINVGSIPITDALNTWFLGYLHSDSEVVNMGGSGFFWIPILFGILKKTAYLLVPLAIMKKKSELARDEYSQGLFIFFLFFYAFTNFLQIVPVLGVRMFWFVQIWSIYMIFRVYGMKSNLYILILFACAWDIFTRYFYGGAVSRDVPLIIFYTPLPYLIEHYWGIESMLINQPEGVDFDTYL